MHTEILDWCKRQVTDPVLKEELFTYRHIKYGTFVIAQWINRSSGLFVDVLNLEHSLGNFTHEIAQEFKRRFLAPETAQDIAKQIRGLGNTHLRQCEEESEELSRIGTL